jgi:uncharacterized membrane protein YfcA
LHLDLPIAFAGLVVGFTVGLTGMGGGALMTPILVLLFKVQPLAAVSSDLVAAVVMKPIGGAVHARRGTVHKELVRWLVAGSVPSAFAGVLILRAMGDGQTVQDRIKVVLGATLLVAAVAMVVKGVLQRRRGGVADDAAPAVRPLATLAIGVAGGLVVGMTSVGSGSLIIVCLMLVYPRIASSALVGTRTASSLPASNNRTSCSASRRSVLTRSCAARGIFPGAATTHWIPAAVSARASPNPVGPAS